MAQKTLAFDVYGTLIDTAGVFKSLEMLVGDKATIMTELWRSKQLEYSFRRGLMQNYQDFSVCTRQALDYCCEALSVDLSGDQKDGLLKEYRFLPAFPDVVEGLQKFKATGFSLFAFSNGRADDVRNLLGQAKIDAYFQDVVSCDEVNSFKPNPGVYAHFLRRAESVGSEAWMISSNPFDVIGALSAGMRAAWVKRSSNAVFDPWGIEPTLVAADFVDLVNLMGND